MDKFVSFFQPLINSIKGWLGRKSINQANSEFDPESIILEIFNQLHPNFDLGVSEYLAAIEAVKGGWGTDNQKQLKEMLELLWCPPVEQYQFDLIWKSVISAPQRTNKESSSSRSKSKIENQNPSKSTPQKTEPVPPESTTSTTSDLTTVPALAPSNPAKVDEIQQIHTYWPVSRRFMIYIWRYLQRPVADGAEDLLDVNATIDKTVNQGFFLAPVYDHRQRNHAHLVLLVDQNGSMTPFHRFSRDLVETAQFESSIERVNIYYFHNVPATSLYQDPYLTKPVPLEKALENCDRDTSVFIVSDAGAARGYRRLERIQETTEALFKIKQFSNQIVWLNPMPKKRWVSTSAQIISNLIPMYQLNNDGLSNAINHIGLT